MGAGDCVANFLEGGIGEAGNAEDGRGRCPLDGGDSTGEAGDNFSADESGVVDPSGLGVGLTWERKDGETSISPECGLHFAEEAPHPAHGFATVVY